MHTLIKGECPYVDGCDKYLTVCKHKYFSDCIHLLRLQIVDEVYEECFEPLLCVFDFTEQFLKDHRKDN